MRKINTISLLITQDIPEMLQENSLNSLCSRVELCFETKLEWRNNHIKECANLVSNYSETSPQKCARKITANSRVLPNDLFHTLSHIWRVKLVDLCSEQEKHAHHR